MLLYCVVSGMLGKPVKNGVIDRIMGHLGEMSLSIKPVRSKRDLRRFIDLPAELHRDHKTWVPPFRIMERRYFNPKINTSLKTCQTSMVLAYRNSTAVGRIMVGVHHKYNTLRGERNARFSLFECTNEPEVAQSLLEYAEQWACKRGMKKIVGPMGLSEDAPEPQGFLVEGFEHNPSILTNCNFEYIVEFLAAAGYDKEVDYVVYKIPIPEKMPDLYERIHQRVMKKREYRLLDCSKRRDLRPYAKQVLRLMNESYLGLYGYLPRDDREEIAFPVIALNIFDPRFVQLVSYRNEIVGFVLALPNVSKGIRRSKGKLLPLGFIPILREAKRSKQLDLLLGGIKKEHRGKGIDVLMGYRMFVKAREAGFAYMDSHLELETNTLIRREMEAMQGKVYKRFRIFQKSLS